MDKTLPMPGQPKAARQSSGSQNSLTTQPSTVNQPVRLSNHANHSIKAVCMPWAGWRILGVLASRQAAVLFSGPLLKAPVGQRTPFCQIALIPPHPSGPLVYPHGKTLSNLHRSMYIHERPKTRFMGIHRPSWVRAAQLGRCIPINLVWASCIYIDLW